MSPVLPSHIVVRKAQKDDEKKILGIAAELPDYFTNEGLADIEADLKSSTHETMVAEMQGEVAGFLTSEIQTPALAHLWWMGVRPDLRGTGVGKRLMEDFFSRMQARGVRTVELATIAATTPFPPFEATRRFFHSFGFKKARIDKDYYAPGDDRVIMRKELSAEERHR